MAQSIGETPRQFVRRQHPAAKSETCGDVFQIVVVGAFAVANVLGWGRTPRRAWADAARKLSKKGGSA